MSDDYPRIKRQYENVQGDSTELFNEVLKASREIGMDEALAYLEQCVIEKRLAWLDANLDREVCKKVYQKPVQEFLKRIHPKLRFDRNYESIRPHAACCEEIIRLED